MINVRVQFRYSPTSQRRTSAVLIPGDDATAWLRELAGWNVRLTALELFIVPSSSDDIRPRGLLVRFPDGSAAPQQTAGHAYGVVADRLFVPVEATIHPHVTDVEWRTLLSADYIACVWQPQTGLVGFEAADRLRVADLLAVPSVEDTDWGRADAGMAFNARLIVLEVPRFPTPEEILEEGRDDIGSRSKEPSGLPRTPRETAGRMVRGIVSGIVAPFAYVARWVARHAPRVGAGPARGGAAMGGGRKGRSWLGRVEEWAGKVLQNAADLWNARKRELDRLLHLLDDNPDEGLKYALPTSGWGDAYRGRARPGTRLTQQSVEFSLGGVFGGGLADVWDLPIDYQQQLLERYRRLAEREVRLGRHRRAAYIYAHLLTDLSAAAATLAAGGHYRDAAVLYRDKLQRPADAARCLEQGGLLHEAIPIYEELGDFVHVGDLYTRLDQPDDARAAYRRAVEGKLQQRDHIGAAALLDQKLDSTEEALAALDAGWPDSAQARQCLLDAFHLLARDGRHDEAARRVRKLRDEPVASGRVQLLVEFLALTADSYPDVTLMQTAADATRVVTSRALLGGHRESRQLLSSVAQLVPQDRLLERDCRRYTKSTLPRPKAVAPVSKGQDLPELVCRIPLPGPTEWVAAASTANGFYVAGYRARELVVVRGAWRGPEEPLTEVSWKSHLLTGAPLLMSVDEGDPITVRLLIPGGPRLPPRSLPPTEHFPDHVSAETPGWLPDDTIGMDAAAGVTWVVEAAQFVVKGYTREGLPIAIRSLRLSHETMVDLASRGLPPDPVAVHARTEGVFVGIGRQLFRIIRGDQVDTFGLNRRIQSLAGTAPLTRTQVAVLCERGGSVFQPNVSGGEFTRIPNDFAAPRGAFLRDGRLVLPTENYWFVGSTQPERLHLETAFRPLVSDLLAVLPTPEPNEFAVCSREKEMLVYRLRAV